MWCKSRCAKQGEVNVQWGADCAKLNTGNMFRNDLWIRYGKAHGQGKS